MLAKNTMAEVWNETHVPEPAPDLEYNGFPWWIALLVQPNSEEKSAAWFERVNVHVYLPQFSRQVRCRGKSHRHQLSAVLPGMLFVPAEVMDIPRRDEVFDYAQVRGYLRAPGGGPAMLAKDKIEIVREIEARLNMPPPAKLRLRFKVGDRVRFHKELYAAFFGDGRVVSVAHSQGISVEVDRLFGGPQVLYVAPDEIERM